MKTTREEIAIACYKVEGEMVDTEITIPKSFEKLPHWVKLKYRAKADNWLKVYGILKTGRGKP